MINICGSVCIPGAKHGMLELIPQTLFFLERASANTEGGSGYPRLVLTGILTSGLQVVKRSSLVSILFRETFSHPYISFFH